LLDYIKLNNNEKVFLASEENLRINNKKWKKEEVDEVESG
jgi:hypothetical protein